MLEVAIMVEGQDGLNWPRWQRLAPLVEDLGFVGLYRSDHFTNSRPPDRDSLELWVSLTWLATHSRRLEFGPLVTPFSFRDPVFTARMALAVDDLSGGRLTLGIGAGWQDREHDKFGYDLLDVERRFQRYEEGAQVVKGLLRSDEPFTFTGEFYRVREAVLLPRPQRPGGPLILVGGNGRRRTLPMVVRHATEWNAVSLTPAVFAERSRELDRLLLEAGRNPAEVRRSMMTGLIFGRDQAEAARKANGRDLAEVRARGAVAGTADEVVDQLRALAAAGVQRVMLQWLELDDLERLVAFGRTVQPALGRA
jgi:F420-dependent oxidoreductase-like protein